MNTIANAWLALDRDGDGKITSGRELFGTATVLLGGGPADHGFQALAEFDHNADGRIDQADPVFSQLRLWTDTQRDGIGELHELHLLSTFGIVAFDLDFKQSQRRDAEENVFRYRAKVYASEAPVVRYAYDVFLAVRPLQ